MRVELFKDFYSGTLLITFEWLENNVGHLGEHWDFIIESNEITGNEIISMTHIEIDNELDVMAYKLRFKVNYHIRN